MSIPALIAFGYAPSPPPWHDPPRWLAKRRFSLYLGHLYGIVILTLAINESFYAIACIKVWAHMFFYAQRLRDVAVAIVFALLAFPLAGSILGMLAVSLVLAATAMALNEEPPDRAARVVAMRNKHNTQIGLSQRNIIHRRTFG